MITAYIGLGSNLDAPSRQIRSALRELDETQGIELCQVSSLYGSEPMGPKDQPDYVNAVAEIETQLSPEELLKALFIIEDHHGRNRERQIRWGARTLDLDLLLYADLQMHTTELIIPHVGICERPFVIFPLLEIAPEVEIPGVGKGHQCIEHMDPASITQL